MFKKIKKIKKIYWIIIGVIILAIAFIGFDKKNQNEHLSYDVVKTTVSDELVFAGIIDAERRVDLGFATGGRLIKNNVEEGDFVEKGQLLAEVDQSAVRAGLIQANANYQLTKIDTTISADNTNISYDELLKEQDIVVENLRQQYVSGDLQAYLIDDKNLSYSLLSPIITGNYLLEKEGVYELDMYKSAAQSGYSYRYSGLESGRSTAEVYKTEKLGNSGLYIQFVADTRYNYSQWEIPVPNTRSATYLSRKTAYENALAQRDKILADAKNNVDKLTKKDATSNISYSDARINNAQAQINASAVRLSDGKIRAPFDAYVVKNNLELGETVQALTPQITLFASKKKKLILNTPEIYINKIHVGDEVGISLDAYPDIAFDGHIVKIDDIDTLADGVPVYQTEVIFNDEDERLRVGMNAHARIISSEKVDVLAIPKHFIDEGGDKKIVFIMSDSEIREQVIETGLEGNNGLIEIVSGLSEGQLIILKK